MSSTISNHVALIFGVGSNVGASLVKGFLNAGYRVATVSRSKATLPVSSSTLSIQADLADVSTIPGVFTQLSTAGWPAPSVVIWNAASFSRPAASDPQNPLEVPLEDFDRDLNLMVRSPYIAAQAAVREWKKKTEEGRKGTFIMTGNIMPRKILSIPTLITSGAGKSAANYWVGLSDATFKKEGIRFFFADERTADGAPVYSDVNGAAHSEMYLRLTQDNEVPYYVTFVDGKHKEFFP